MSENIMYKNIADKMKQESIEVIRDSYDETMPKQEFERSLKYIEDYITDLQADNQELQDAVVWWNNRYNALQRDYEDYKSRCEKADEYIKDIFKDEKWYENYEYNDLENALKNVSNILNGRSDK